MDLVALRGRLDISPHSQQGEASIDEGRGFSQVETIKPPAVLKVRVKDRREAEGHGLADREGQIGELCLEGWRAQIRVVNHYRYLDPSLNIGTIRIFHCPV